MTAEQLRTLVAERVMGCELKIAQEDQGYDEEWWVFPADGEACMSEMRLRGQWLPDVTWADAGRVIERMVELGWELVFYYWPDGQAQAQFVIWETPSAPRRQGIGLCQEPKEAISLAALRALGVEVE